MKKLFSMLVAAALFGLMACGGSNQEATEGVQEAEAPVEEMNEQLENEAAEATEPAAKEGEEMLAEHVCSDKCTEEAHYYLHGEKGHVCDESCNMTGEGATEGEVQEVSGEEAQ